MQVNGMVCVHFSKDEGSDKIMGVLTYVSDQGEEYERSEPFEVTTGNVACFGPVCAQCDLSAVFSYEPETKQGQQAKGPQRPPAPGQPARPGQPAPAKKV